MMFAGRICTFVREDAARWNEWKVEKPNSADAGKRLGKMRQGIPNSILIESASC